MAAAKKPVAKKAIVKKPVAKKAIVKKPVAKKPAVKKETVVKKPRTKKVALEPVSQSLLDKEAATKAGEPWVSVLSVDLDMDNISNGSMELDWNDLFIAKLVRAGYKGSDIEMVDQWFSSLCRNILQENFEQEQADPENRKK